MGLHYDDRMRTTIDLPDDLHRIASAIARDRGATLSETVAQLLASALNLGGRPELRKSPRTGMLVLHVGHPITDEDVRSLEDDW